MTSNAILTMNSSHFFLWLFFYRNPHQSPHLRPRWISTFCLFDGQRTNIEHSRSWRALSRQTHRERRTHNNNKLDEWMKQDRAAPTNEMEQRFSFWNLHISRTQRIADAFIYLFDVFSLLQSNSDVCVSGHLALTVSHTHKRVPNQHQPIAISIIVTHSVYIMTTRWHTSPNDVEWWKLNAFSRSTKSFHDETAMHERRSMTMSSSFRLVAVSFAFAVNKLYTRPNSMSHSRKASQRKFHFHKINWQNPYIPVAERGSRQNREQAACNFLNQQT